jgi:hypothetical protein
MSVDAADQQGPFELLPETALDLVLQQLDSSSLANLAVCCSRLRHVFAAYTSQVVVRCRSQKMLRNFIIWLKRNSSRLSQLTQCTVLDSNSGPYSELKVETMPCSQLRHLRLRDVCVQLGPSELMPEDFPGVLHGCTGLTALDLDCCRHCDIHADFADIAALPELQHLRVVLSAVDYPYPCRLFPQFQNPLNLTHLSISYDIPLQSEPVQHLDQLSALVNLQHLGLFHLPHEGVPGGWPSELVKLTCLHAHYRYVADVDVEEQFQHLSCLTALQRMTVSCRPQPGQSSVPGIHLLPQLSSLKLEHKGSSDSPGLQFSTAITHSWACRTVLRGISLVGCAVQPQALAALTQLQGLWLERIALLGDADAPAEDLLRAVSQLTGLKALEIRELPELREQPLLLHLTALTALVQLVLINMCKPGVHMVFIGLTNKVRNNGAMDNALVVCCMAARHVDSGTGSWGQNIALAAFSQVPRPGICERQCRSLMHAGSSLVHFAAQQ